MYRQNITYCASEKWGVDPQLRGQWWTTQGLVPTPQRDKTPKEAALDVYYDLIDNDPNQRFSGLSENDVEELRQVMTEMDGVEVTPEVAWSTARSVLELVRTILEFEVKQRPP